jgi:hypothetical protein
MIKIVRPVVLSLVASVCSLPECALAEEMRVVDRTGLLRLVGAVSGEANIVIELDPQTAQATKECILTNLDGLATERRAPVDRNGRCTIHSVLATTWQIDSPAVGRYQVRLEK